MPCSSNSDTAQLALHKSVSAREAGDSIKPGRKPQVNHPRTSGARETGDSLCEFRAVARFTGSNCGFNAPVLGLAPQALCCRPLRGLGARHLRAQPLVGR